jgi:hypothetical protein
MGPRLVLREELLWRDDVDKGWGKRGLFACRYIPRDSLTGLITPVRKNLQEVSAGVGSSDLFTQRVDLCYHLHVVYPGKYSCGSVSVSLYLWREGLYSEAKEETWIRSRLLWRLTRYGVEQN